MKRNTIGINNSNWRGGIRKRRDGYITEYCPDHPYASLGAVLQHRLVYERYHGIILSPDIIIHHKNGIKYDNRIENLEATTLSEHAKKHLSFKGREYRRPMDGKNIECLICKKVFYVPKSNVNRRKYCSKGCSGISKIKPEKQDLKLFVRASVNI